MSQFKNFDAHIDASQTSVRAVWEITLSSLTIGTPAAGDTIEWGASGFTLGTGRGLGIVTNYINGRLRFYRTDKLTPEATAVLAFPIAGTDQVKHTVAGTTGLWVATIASIAKKNASGYQINPPWFTGTPPTTRTQKALTSTGGDYLLVDDPIAMNQNRVINASGIGVDSFNMNSAWGATPVVDSPAVITYVDGLTYRQGLILPNAGDRMIPEILNRNFGILDRTGWRFEGAMIEMASTQTLTADTATKLNFNTLVYEDLPLFGTSAAAGSIVDLTNFRLKVLPHWSRVAVFGMVFATVPSSSTHYMSAVISKNGVFASYTGRPGATVGVPSTLAINQPTLTLWGMPPHTVGGTDTFEVYASVTSASMVIQAKSYFGIIALKYAGQFP